MEKWALASVSFGAVLLSLLVTFDPASARSPKEWDKLIGAYVITSLSQYQDVDAALKIVEDALAKAGKK
jgi:hypothetical protein